MNRRSFFRKTAIGLIAAPLIAKLANEQPKIIGACDTASVEDKSILSVNSSDGKAVHIIDTTDVCHDDYLSLDETMTRWAEETAGYYKV